MLFGCIITGIYLGIREEEVFMLGKEDYNEVVATKPHCLQLLGKRRFLLFVLGYESQERRKVAFGLMSSRSFRAVPSTTNLDKSLAMTQLCCAMGLSH